MGKEEGKGQRKGADGVGLDARERIKGKRTSEKAPETPQKRAKVTATKSDTESGSEGGGGGESGV